jgi:diguanylate cyclase (GGDEF)-like protein
LQQQELVQFLYSRVEVGMLLTILISAVASGLAYFELSIQGRENWVLVWFALLCVILFARLCLLQRFAKLQNKEYFPYQEWHRKFYIGVVASGLMQGCGAAALMPYVTPNVQIILHSLLLSMAAGAIAYLSMSLRIYISYLVTIMLPVTIWLFLRQTPDGYVLGLLYLFLMTAASISVKRMNVLINDALYYRFDNETLVEDLQRLLASVSKSNKALEKISTTDELTGASNYRAFRVELEEVWRQHQGTNIPVSLVKLNIDYYREYNAQYGLDSGDLQLREIARLLMAETSHQNQMVARLNGAEFAVLLPGVSCENARLLMLRVIQALEDNKIDHAKSKINQYLTLSVGLSCQVIGDKSSSRELLGKVYNALKSAKDKGGNRIGIVET